jgi:hypothetical protein
MIANYVEQVDMSTDPLTILLRREGADDEADNLENFVSVETEQLITRDLRESSELRVGKVGMTLSVLDRSRARHSKPKVDAEILCRPKPFVKSVRAVKKGMTHTL